MDGQNVYWNLLDILAKDRKDNPLAPWQLFPCFLVPTTLDKGAQTGICANL